MCIYSHTKIVQEAMQSLFHMQRGVIGDTMSDLRKYINNKQNIQVTFNETKRILF